MPKVKTKPVLWGKIATETEWGGWEWENGGIKWWWKAGVGVNFGMNINDELKPMAYMKTLAEAGLFVEGFIMGKSYAEQAAERVTPRE